jgi:osomolarity two-component system phosphorelay intermediate protein YPD1
MDDDEEERDFSTSIVFDFFDQAKNTFKNLDKAL